MTPAEVADLIQRARALRRSLTRDELPVSSPAKHFEELALSERGTATLTHRVIVVADLWTLVTAEQVGGLAAVLRDNGGIFSLFPLCRSIIEHSFAVAWVLDPEVSPEARCARAALAIERSYEGMCIAASHMGGRGNDIHQGQRKALGELRRAIASEFPAGEDTAPRVAGEPIAGQVLASPTELAVEFDRRFGTGQEWQGIYEYLCATANHPSLSAFEFFEFDEQRGLHININDDFLERLFRATIVAFVKALQSYAGYCEWDPEGIDELIDSTNALLPGSFA